MRKVSKSRVDDDVISSTNGSTANDDNGDAGDDKPTSEGRNSAINDSTNNDFDANSDSDSQKSSEKQKGSKKRKTSKRKSGKDDANTEEEDNNDDDASNVSKEGKKKGKKGVQNKKRKSTRDKSVTNYDDNEENDENEDNDDDASQASKEGKKKGKKGAQNKKRKSTRDKSVTNNDDNEEEDDEEEEYEVEKVVGSKKIKGKLHYLIRWKGYSASSDTWEPENTLSCPELINKYNEENENSSKNDDKATPKKKKKGKKEVSPAKRPKMEWDGEKADKNAEYEVARILEVHHKKNGDREFLIHWKGWSSKFDSWEPERHLNCSDLIEKFMEKVKTSSYADNRSLRVAPETTNRFTLQDPTGGRRLSKRRGQRQRVRYDDAE